MRSMSITPDTPMVFVLEMYPQTLPAFQSIGVCCVHDGNMNSTVGQVCAEGNTDAESFIAALREIIGR